MGVIKHALKCFSKRNNLSPSSHKFLVKVSLSLLIGLNKRIIGVADSSVLHLPVICYPGIDSLHL
jgi:hypothetical protein